MKKNKLRKRYMAICLRSILSPLSLGEGLGVRLLIALLLFSSCSSDDTEVFGVKPTGGVEFTPIPGGAKMTYTLPDNVDVMEIRARYNDVNGKEVIVSGSYLDKELQLVGFNEARTNIPVYISYVNRQGICSEEYSTTFSTGDSGAFAFFNTAEVKPSWDGFELSYDLPEDGMTGFAHVFYVGVNPNTQKTDTLLLGSVTLAKGKTKKNYTMTQQFDKNTIVVKTEDFRGYFVKQKVWSDIASYPTTKVDNDEMNVSCEYTYEDEEYGLGLKYLTDGDVNGRSVLLSSAQKYFTFAMGPFAFGKDIIITLDNPRTIASVRVYAQMKCLDYYSRPIWYYNYIDTLPCEVVVYGSNDATNWTELGSYSEPSDASGEMWWGRDNLIQRMSPLTLDQIDSVDPIYMEIKMPINDDTFKYVKVVPTKTFDISYEGFRNTEQYVSMQELEIYIKK